MWISFNRNVVIKKDKTLSISIRKKGVLPALPVETQEDQKQQLDVSNGIFIVIIIVKSFLIWACHIPKRERLRILSPIIIRNRAWKGKIPDEHISYVIPHQASNNEIK